LADHVIACRHCSDAYRILARTHEETRQAPGASRLAWRAAAAAAIALLAITGVLLLRSNRPVPGDAVRGVAATSSAVVPGDGAMLGEPPAELRWPARPAAEGYRVRLFDSAGSAVFEADAGTAQRLALPDAVRSRVRAGGSYFWTVEVRTPNERQRLGPFSFTLRP